MPAGCLAEAVADEVGYEVMGAQDDMLRVVVRTGWPAVREAARKRGFWGAMALTAAVGLSACGASSGIVPVGPDTYSVSEMRAAAIGGGARAEDVALSEAAGFCRRQGRSVALLDTQPGGDPRGYYWPTAFTAIFQCVAGPSSAGGYSRGGALR